MSWTGLESQERSSDGLENLQLCSGTQQLQEGGQVQIIGASRPAGPQLRASRRGDASMGGGSECCHSGKKDGGRVSAAARGRRRAAVEPLRATAVRRSLLPCDGVPLGQDERRTLCSDAAGRLLSPRLALSPAPRARRGKSNKPTPPLPFPKNQNSRKKQQHGTRRPENQSVIRGGFLNQTCETSGEAHGAPRQLRTRSNNSPRRPRQPVRLNANTEELTAPSGSNGEDEKYASATSCGRIRRAQASCTGRLPRRRSSPTDPVEGVPPPSVHSGTGSAGRTSQHLLTGAHVTRR